MRSRGRVGLGAATLVAAGALMGTASAQQAAPAGDAAHGKSISYTCLGCHGVEGYRNAYPDYSVPKLEGQTPEYLSAALHGYRDGDRSHLTMHAQASMLSDQDIADIAAYFGAKPLAAGKGAGASVPKQAQLCTTCHGQDGVAIAAMYPSLAGQHGDYIRRALEEYKNGGRKNPIMKGFAGTLTDEDRAVISAYFSALAPGLRTVPRPYTVLSSK